MIYSIFQLVNPSFGQFSTKFYGVTCKTLYFLPLSIWGILCLWVFDMRNPTMIGRGAIDGGIIL